eukprot:1741224-Alexandrium_andersonii.AAC.1
MRCVAAVARSTGCRRCGSGVHLSKSMGFRPLEEVKVPGRARPSGARPGRSVMVDSLGLAPSGLPGRALIAWKGPERVRSGCRVNRHLLLRGWFCLPLLLW